MVADGIKSKVLSGLKWNSISVFATRSTDFLVKLILARLLLPDAYGVVGMAMLIIGFLNIVSDMGLFNALVQKKEDELTDVRYCSSFWFLLVLALVFICCFFLFISPLCASFYNEPRLIPILNALSFYFFFNILSIVPRVILTRKLDFKNLVRITYFGTALSSVMAVVLALLGFGVWSLVVKSLVGSGIIFFSYWVKVGWRPKFIFKGRVLTQLAGYSTYTQINGILFYFRNNLDYLIIGKLVSAHLLGVYTLAFTLSESLRSQLYSIFNKVFFPIYSKIQDDKDQIKYYYLKVMRLTAAVTFPVSVIFIGLAENIVLVLFGPNWIEAAEPLRILAVASMIFAISGTPAEVLKSIGKPSVSFYLNLINTFLVALPLIYFGQIYFGLTGVASAVCVHYTISRLTFHYYMKKYIYITDRDVFLALRKPIIAAAAMLSIIYCTAFIQVSLLSNLLLAGFTGSLAYSLFFIGDLKKGLKLIKKGRVSNFFKLLSLHFKKPSFVYYFRKTVFKMFPPNGKAYKYAELQGNKDALLTDFWNGQVVKVKPAPFCLIMMKGKPVTQDEFEKAEEFIALKLQQALTYPKGPVYTAFDFVRLRKLEEYGLDFGLIDQAEEILKSVSLPVTTAHGDLHMGNLICVGHEIKIIDWSMFTNKGTFITDFIHFYNYDSAVKHRESWTISILKDQYYLNVLVQKFETTPNHLRLAYCINRISGETLQKQNFNQLSTKQIIKYNYVLNQIINEFREAVVQRCDSVIQ